MLAAAAITLLSFSGAQAAAAPAPLRVQNLDQVIRCAGLTQAASELEGGESGDGRALYDAALFWSLTAIQAGQAARRPRRYRDPGDPRPHRRRARTDHRRRRRTHSVATLP
jgi:hypothetical protein